MAKKPNKGTLSKDNSVVRGMRWPLPVWSVLEKIAKEQGVKPGIIARDLVIAQLENNVEHEALMEYLNPEDSKEAQKNFFNALDNKTEMILSTITKYCETLIKKNNKQDKLIRELMFLLLYLSPETPQEEQIDRQRSANRRLKKFLENFDKENS